MDQRSGAMFMLARNIMSTLAIHVRDQPTDRWPQIGVLLGALGKK
jgi:hypothetical protein